MSQDRYAAFLDFTTEIDASDEEDSLARSEMKSEVEGWFKEAVAAFGQGQLARSAELCSKILEQEPEVHAAWHLAGVVATTSGDFEGALAHFEKAISLVADIPDYHNNCAIVLRRLNRNEEALAAYSAALRLQPDRAAFLSNIGDVYVELERWEEAQESFERALSLEPGHRDAKFNLANLMRDMGRLKKATGLYTDLLVQSPDDPEIHWNLGLTQLLADDYSSGFESYGWREKLPDAPPLVPLAGVPRWQGQSLEGRMICLTAEQGFGDSLQMVRFASHLAQAGARVVLRVPARLVKLLSHVSDVAQVYSESQKIEGCDYWVPMMSVPDILGLAIEDVQVEEPYIESPRMNLPALCNVFEEATGLRVAINWQGDPNFINDRYRSFDLEVLAPIWQLAGVTVWSIQKGFGEEALGGLSEPQCVTPLGHLLDLGADGFLETAEVLVRSDLLITSDTAVAHLAGALGVEVWLMVSMRPDWRWGTHRTRSTWYPTMRIFRQRELGSWGDVVTEICEELKKRMETT